jgi:hypothetical protein
MYYLSAKAMFVMRLLSRINKKFWGCHDFAPCICPLYLLSLVLLNNLLALQQRRGMILGRREWP